MIFIKNEPDKNVGAYINYFSKFVILFAVYLVTAKIGPSIATQNFSAAVWIPSGIALVSILLFGYKYWPAIALGEFIVNWYFAPLPVDVSLYMAIGDTAETLLAVYILRRFGFKISFNHLKDMVLLIAVAIVCTAISATFGVSSLYLINIIPASAYILAWKTWWVANTLSILIIPPLILSWINKPIGKITIKKIFEFIIFGLILYSVDLIVFHKVLNAYFENPSSTYLFFPLLIWAALRFGVRGTSVVIFLVTAVSIIETSFGLGPFFSDNLAYNLLSLQIFIGTITSTIMLLAVVESERKEMEQRKDIFICLASHELRTPITSIKAFSQILLSTPINNNLSIIKVYLKKMDYQVENMIHLINALLNLSRIQSNTLVIQKEKFALDKLIYDVVEIMQETHQVSSIEIRNTMNDDCVVFADKESITEVVINLLTNAIKYSPKTSKKIIGIKPARKGFVEVSFTDFGIGMTKEEVEKIFDKYYRVCNMKGTTISGLGIGLYISDQIIRKHNGRISVISTPGKGSTFSFILPMASAATYS